MAPTGGCGLACWLPVSRYVACGKVEGTWPPAPARRARYTLLASSHTLKVLEKVLQPEFQQSWHVPPNDPGVNHHVATAHCMIDPCAMQISPRPPKSAGRFCYTPRAILRV